ncbi:MAG TPA: protein kinase [Thermoanaerobaculia bacterium]|jgi:serine/threonine-protein kinase
MPFFCIHCRSEIDPKYKACPFCGEAITDFLRRHLEAPIDGKYQILSRLGVGGMGEVYKVLHLHLNAIRVIKLMRPNIAADPGAGDRFLREARLATKIHHSNVAALYDFSQLDDGSFYMVWEYIEGINLHELIAERGPLSPQYTARIAAEALHGLEAVHRAGIVHRDISPENLMISRSEDGEERVKIIDLGIAKGGDEMDNKTKTGMFVGKWKYCSPEHLGMIPDGERIDGRADLYSFGIVLYEMLTGVPPFQADTPHRYLMLHASERPKALREVNPATTASAELEALIFRAMEKDRRNRFASAREFAQALEKLIPLLPDTPGSPLPLPASAELTEEPTRVGGRVAQDAKTVVSIASDAPTVQTMGPMGPSGTPMSPVSPVSPIAPTPTVVAPRNKKKASLGWIVALAIVAALGVVGWQMFDRNDAIAEVPKNVAAPVQTPVVSTSASVIVPLAQGRLAINAFPWATVTAVRNLDNGETVDIRGPLVTPAPLDLAPGRYEITLTNPDFPAPITRTVLVRGGQDETLNVAFTDPDRAPLPSFGGAVR